MHSTAINEAVHKPAFGRSLCMFLLLFWCISQSTQALETSVGEDAGMDAPVLLLYEKGSQVNRAALVARQLEQILQPGYAQQVLEQRIQDLLFAHYASGGYFSARIDSLAYSTQRDTLTIWANPGCRYTFGEVVLKGMQELQEDARHQLNFFNNSEVPFDEQLLEAKLLDTVSLLEQNGYLLANARLLKMQPRAEVCEVDLVIQIQAGSRFEASGVHISGLERYDPEFVATATGIRNHMWLTPQTFTRGRRNLLNTGLFREVSQGELLVGEQGGLAWYHVEEQPSNHVDLMLGYAPGVAGRHRIAGRADLGIRNVLWSGSLLELFFEATEPGATKMNTGFQRQWIRGYPLGIGMHFDMVHQDTLYQNRQWSLRTSWDLNDRNRLIVSASRHITVGGLNESQTPTAGNAVLNMAGTGYEYSTLDHPRRPRTGHVFGIHISYGFKQFENLPAELLTYSSTQRQQRMASHLRVFRNPWQRHVVALRAEALVLEADMYAEPDLFRLGGAASMRGYREDRFRAARAVWYDAEHRYLLDQDAHAFVFVASGHLNTPSIPGRYEAQNQWLFSAGFGFRYEIPLGLMQFTYAVSREDPVYNGKVHIQITSGF